MESKSVKDILKFQEELNQRMQKRMEAMITGKAPTLEELVEDKQNQLQGLKQRLEALRQAKEQVIRRYDEDIRRCEESVSRLDKEIKQGQASIRRTADKTAETEGIIVGREGQ